MASYSIPNISDTDVILEIEFVHRLHYVYSLLTHARVKLNQFSNIYCLNMYIRSV